MFVFQEVPYLLRLIGHQLGQLEQHDGVVHVHEEDLLAELHDFFLRLNPRELRILIGIVKLELDALNVH